MKFKDKLKRFVSQTPPQDQPAAEVIEPTEGCQAQDLAWGGQEQRREAGSHYYLKKSFPLPWVHGGSDAAGSRPGGRPLAACTGTIGGALAFLAQDANLTEIDLEQMLFLDTETTGLAMGTGTLPFLIGVGQIRDNAFVVEQFLMRDFPEEASALEALAQRIEEAAGIVTFNGKRFDWPLLKDRFMLQRVRLQTRGLLHLDLLYPARRLWRYRFTSCSLGTLEAEVLGFVRSQDVAGSEVPQRYFQFLKDGNPDHLTAVLQHNLWDILSLTTLTVHLKERAQWGQINADDTLLQQPCADLGFEMEGMARLHSRSGSWQATASLTEWALALEPSADLQLRLLKLLGQAYKKLGLRQASAAVYQRVVQEWPAELLAWEELAKFHEHSSRRGLEALACTEQGLGQARQQRHGRMEQRFNKRLQRLQRRQQQGGTLDFGGSAGRERLNPEA